MSESIYDMNLRLDKLIVENRVSSMTERREAGLGRGMARVAQVKGVRIAREHDLGLELEELANTPGLAPGSLNEIIDEESESLAASGLSNEKTGGESELLAAAGSLLMNEETGGESESLAAPESLDGENGELPDARFSSKQTGELLKGGVESESIAVLLNDGGEGESQTNEMLQKMHIRVLNVTVDSTSTQPAMEIEEVASDGQVIEQNSDDEEGLPPPDEADTVKKEPTVDNEVHDTTNNVSLNTSNKRGRRKANRA